MCLFSNSTQPTYQEKCVTNANKTILSSVDANHAIQLDLANPLHEKYLSRFHEIDHT